MSKLEIEKGKDKLLALEKEGEYTFHGSHVLTDELEPRQAQRWDSQTNKMVNDGEPAVVTTPFVEIAIFRAIISNDSKAHDGEHHSSFRYSNYDGKINLEFRTTPSILKQAENRKGYVYVFKKEADFIKNGGMELRIHRSIKPSRIFEVGFEDLPKNVDLSSQPIK